MTGNILPDNLAPAAEIKERSHWRKKVLLWGGGFFVLLILLALSRASVSFRQISSNTTHTAIFAFDPEPDFRPFHDPERLTVLLLGMRGEGDPDGGLLTDTLIVASVDKRTGRTLLLSLPRDLWVRLPGKPREDKLNAVYALGFTEGGKALALDYARVVVERVTGMKIDYVINADLALVRDLIDALGGLTLTLKRPFTEDKQWVRGGDMGTSSAFMVRGDQWVFELPGGRQTLDGNTALYYVRARYTSDDFDRERRAQEVLLALRERILSLGVLLNPLKIDELLRAFERHVVTDISLGKIPDFATLLVRSSGMRRLVLANGPEGLLETKYVNGLYTLFPRNGNFEEIRQFVRDEIAKDSATTAKP